MMQPSMQNLLHVSYKIGNQDGKRRFQIGMLLLIDNTGSNLTQTQKLSMRKQQLKLKLLQLPQNPIRYTILQRH